MQLFSAHPTRSRIVLVVLLLIGLLVGRAIVLRTPPMPSLLIIPFPNQIPIHPAPIPDRWIPMSWIWLWRVKEALLPRTKSVLFVIKVIEFPDSAETRLPRLTHLQPHFTMTNNTRAWMFNREELSAFTRLLERLPGYDHQLLSEPRIASGENIQAHLSMTHQIPVNGMRRDVGTDADFFFRIRGEIIDLTALLLCTDAVTNQLVTNADSTSSNLISIRTNLALMTRIQMADGSGVFLVAPGSEVTNGTHIGVLLSAALIP